MRVFNGYIKNGKKQIFEYFIFRCGMTHLYYSFKKLGKTFKLQKELFKTEMNHDESLLTGEIRKTIGLILLKTMFYVMLSVMLVIVELSKSLLVLV